ncbi:integrase, catalytic region, zinc finger, CCHC-type containing protein [Tanacetum coccineum]
MIDSLMDNMIREKLGLKEQVDSLEQNLSKQIKEKESVLQTFAVFKNESKEKENKYMENEIDLEKKIKELDNIICKVGQSAQTVHVLTKPQAFYDNTHKQALGYQNPFYLKKSQWIKPTLYDGVVMSNAHVTMPMIDDEETLILEEESRSKMSEKAKDPKVIAKKISHKPIEYEKLNRLTKDFGKRFSPQQELSAEQAFWFHILNPIIKPPYTPPVIVDVPGELPKASLVNASLEKLKFHLTQFDSVVKKRTTPNALEEDVLLTVMNSMSLNNDSVNMEMQKCESCEKCLNLDAELSKSKQAYNDFLKNYSQLEKHCISLEASMQLQQEVFQNDESCVNQNAVEIQEYFEINDLKARLQDKDKTICKLKDTIKSLRENTKEENVNHDKCDLEPINKELENSVAKLLSENERLCNEINHVKQVFKDQFDSIKQTRVRHKEQSDSLINKLNLKSVENEDLKAQIQDKVSVITSLKNDLRKLKGKEIVENVVHTPSVTTIAPGMFKLDLVPLPPRHQVADWFSKYPLLNSVAIPTLLAMQDRSEWRDRLEIVKPFSVNVVWNCIRPRDAVVNWYDVVWFANYIPSHAFYLWLVAKRRLKTQDLLRPWDVNGAVLTKISSKCGCQACCGSVFPTTYGKSVVQIVLWYLDSGCLKHMTGNRSQLMNFVNKFLGTVRFGNDQIAKIIGYGDYQLGNVIISRVYYVEGLGHNLFSVGQFWSRDTNLYTISLDDMLKSYLICLLSKASKTKSWLWHRRLSHLNFSTLNKLAKDSLTRGVPMLKFQKDHLCSACALKKSKKSSHQPKAEDTNQEKLYLLHMDLCGPMRVVSINGKRYILVIVNDYSRFTWVRFLKTKDEAPAAIIKCIKNIQVRLKATVRNVRTDNGTEFVNQTLREWYENVGITHQTSIARTPQQNGVVERFEVLRLVSEPKVIIENQGADDEEISEGGIPWVIVLGYDGLLIQPVALPSPDYIPGPEDPQTPPVPQDEDEREPMFVQAHDPDYVPEPIYPEYIPLEDEHEFSNDGDDDDGDSSRMSHGWDEDDEARRRRRSEEHLSFRSTTAIVVPIVPISHMREQEPIFISLPTELRLRDSSHGLTPSPSPLILTITTLCMREAPLLALPSPPLPPLPPSLYIPPPVDHRDEIPESKQPPHKRLCLSTLGSRYEGDVGYGNRDTWVDLAEAVSEIAPMTVEEVNARVTELAELHEHDTHDLYALLKDAQDSRSRISQRVDMDSQRVDLLMGDRMTLQETVWMVEEEPYASREAWAHSIGMSQVTHQELQTYRDHVYTHETHLQAYQTQLQLQGTLIQTQHQRRARQPGPEARILDHQDVSRDADSHI